MAAQTMRERTIQFFEIVQSKEGEQLRIPPLAMSQALSDLSRAKVERRRFDSDRTYIGTIQSTDEDLDHLLLHKVRDQSDWLSQINLTTGEWEELESAAGRGYLDTSAITFLPYGNVVAIMQGSTSAPTHKSLEGWLNHLYLFGDVPLVVRPLLTAAEVERLRTADGANKVEIRVGYSQRGALAERRGRLAQILTQAYEDYGDVNLTLTIGIPRRGRKGRMEDQRRLLEDVQDLSEVVPVSEKAKADLVFAEVGSEEQTRLTELVEHHITAKRRVPAVDENGNSIRLTAALRVMVGVAAEHEDQLRLASNADD
ncbi:hypothetical protein [Pseudokineococcus sp. 1T1Z-3]|uniref:hypothetical protein n=1 Tax=Pseudokineococcus sp. 1T1Z-3 TaxID=3132745 RepID=UPI0030A7A913